MVQANELRLGFNEIFDTPREGKKKCGEVVKNELIDDGWNELGWNAFSCNDDNDAEGIILVWYRLSKPGAQLGMSHLYKTCLIRNTLALLWSHKILSYIDDLSKPKRIICSKVM